MESELARPEPNAESWTASARDASEVIRSRRLWREVRSVGESGPRTTVPGHDGRPVPVVQFASNDYLGLSGHPGVIAAATAATERWGTGAGASRLVVGSRPVHDELEAALAAWKGQSAALLFPTGYAANLGVLGALARMGSESGRPIGIVSDELNHASIIDGARLARVGVSVYPHCDVDRAAAGCAEIRSAGLRPLLVTDSVFSMDGDVAPVEALSRVAADAGALLVVDDAHSVFAATSPRHLDCELLIVGTLSKSLGSIGGFVAGPTPLVDWIRNTARSSIFSTAGPPSAAAAALAALAVVGSPEGDRLVQHLRHLVDRLDPARWSAVLPVVVGDAGRALDLSAALLQRGFLVPAIRPPTVAPGTSRLRVALTAAHDIEMVDALAAALAELTADYGSAVR